MDPATHCQERTSERRAFWVRAVNFGGTTMKRIMTLLLAVVLAVSLGGCKGKLSVGLATPAQADGGVGAQAVQGLETVKKKLSASARQQDSQSSEEYRDSLNKLAGQKLVFAVGKEMGDPLLYAAQEHSGTSFALLDANPGAPMPNVYGVTFRSQESAFLAGYVASYMPQGGKVGFVAQARDARSEEYEYGYRAGAAFGAREQGRTIEVAVRYAEDTDSSAGELAAGLFGDRAQVVFALDDVDAALKAALDSGRYVICADRTDRVDGMLAVAVKQVGNAMCETANRYLAGSKGGETLSLGLAENCLKLDCSVKVPEDVVSRMERLSTQISGGAIVPPADVASYEVFMEALG